MSTLGVSVICMDHMNFENEVRYMDSLGIDYHHIDVMDGHNVPRYGIYPEIAQRISEISDTPMDVHLMVEGSEFAVDLFAPIKTVEYINFHLDGHERDAYRILDRIHGHGKKGGVCLNMASSFESAGRLMKHGAIESIVFMGIHPGVLKQTARPQNLYLDIRRFAEQYGLPEYVQVDGGVSFTSIEELEKAGANNFVCGTSTLYKPTNVTISRKENVKNNFDTLHKLLGR